MSKPVAYCSITGRGFSEFESSQFIAKGDIFLCPCHGEQISEQSPFAKSPSEEIHEMISQHNASVEKVFYYTEKEVKDLLRIAFFRNHGTKIDFDKWFEQVKKK